MPQFQSHIRVAVMSLMVVLAGLISEARAQQPSPPGGMGAPSMKDPKLDTLERQNREASLRSAEMPPALEKVDQTRIEAALNQLRDDFKRIQIVRNEVAHNVLSNKPFDYAVISVETGEINKRAERLKSFLMPAAIAREKEKEGGEDLQLKDVEMKPALAKLCHLIDGFVDNPTLKNAGTVDILQRKKLGLDLLSIVDLSSQLKKSADKLARANK
jgi:hypothetical protein